MRTSVNEEKKLSTRRSEHVSDCSKPLNQESAMAYHCIIENHKIEDSAKLLKQVDEPHKLNIWESLELFKDKQETSNLYKEGNYHRFCSTPLSDEEN
jgi:hypothetical protein